MDYFVADYLKKKKLYVDVTYISHGVYIIGRGYSVKVQQARDKLLVSDGPSHLSNSYIRVE